MKVAVSRSVKVRSEPEDSIFFNQASVENSGHGKHLIFDGWGGRWFRASKDWVQRGCELVILRHKDGEVCNYNDLYLAWNIETTDFGASCFWPQDPETPTELAFVFTECGPGTRLYDKHGEPVLMVEPDIESFPHRKYMED